MVNEHKALEIETNFIKILWKSKRLILKSKLFKMWLFIILVISSVFIFDLKESTIIRDFNIGNFLSFGITSFSFTLSVLAATLRIFDIDNLTQFYFKKDDKYKNYGELFYITILPYYITPTLWLIVSLLSLLSNVLYFDIEHNAKIALKLVYLSIVIMALLSSWTLFSNHLKDFIFSVQRNINKIRDKEISSISSKKKKKKMTNKKQIKI